MDNMSSNQEVPPGIMDLIKIFLSAKSRGENAVLILEARDKTISTKYRSAEPETGVPVAVRSHETKRRKNPARIQRSRLRLEKFMQMKVNEKSQAETSLKSKVVGQPTTKMLIDVSKKDVGQDDRPAGAGLHSPIIQVDGSGDCDDQVLYKFVSHYHKEDIGYCLEELFPKKNFELVSCVKERPYQSADQQCTVAIRKIAGQDFSWPDGKHDQVFREVRRQ